MRWTTRDYVYVTAECTVGVITVLINSLVLLAIWRYPKLRTVTNCYIGSLAVADLLVGLLVPPLVAVAYAGLPHEFYACVFVNSLVGIFSNISILSLVCLACDRYWAVHRPISRLNLATTQRALRALAAVWVLAIVIGSMPMMGWHNSPEGFYWCSYRRVIAITYDVYWNFLGFLVPILAIMFYLHASIFHAFRAQKRKHSSEHLADLVTQSQNIRLFKSLAMVFTLFAVCWLPLGIINCIYLWFPGVDVNLDFILFTVILTHCNSFFDPLVYGLSQPNVRHVIRDNLHACLRRWRGQRVTSQ